jgi:multiple sugar transport system substrate-binding protein
MKQFFLICVIGLSLASAALYWTIPGQSSDRPVIYWITQDDENKRAILTLWHEWRKDLNLPPVDLRIDNSNQDPTKKLVQGLSGVGADIFDLYGHEMDLFASTGMLADVTEEAVELGFSPAATYPNLKEDFIIGGRQYAFPRNAGVSLLWINRATFAKHGVPEPPARWTVDEFEALGKKFVAAANPPGTRQRSYFVNGLSRDVLRRGLGLANYNETGTRCTLDDPRNAAVLERYRQWVVEDRIIPSKEESSAMSADISGDGSMFSHFTSGRFAMIYTGQWAFIILRPRGTFSLQIAEPPVDGFRNTELGSGTIGIYKGSPHLKESVQFLQFLASEHFSKLIVRIADGLPPLPRLTQTEEYLRPAGREDEWPVHGPFAVAAQETGITVSKSPFVIQSIIYRTELELAEAVIAGRFTAAEAAREMGRRINAEIALAVGRDPKLKQLYAERVALQQKIDDYRAAGRKVPEAWVTDAFHKAYYRAQGWLEEETKP